MSFEEERARKIDPEFEEKWQVWLKEHGLGDHEHQYTIPVEWEYGYYQWNKPPAEAKLLWFTSSENITNKRISKLRCACGEEIDR